MLKHLGERRLDFLDQVRAVAILPVVIAHYHGTWMPGGGMGVGIFFALSGFLIASLLLEEKTLGRQAVARFYIRRIMRIYPLYLIAVTVTVLLIHVTAPQNFGKALHAVPGLLTFTQNSPWVGFSFAVLWTLQVEAWFYITLPIAMLLLGRKRGILIFCAILLALAPLSVFTEAEPSLIHWGAALAFGALVSLAWEHGALSRVRISPKLLAAAGMIGIVALLVPGPLPRSHWYLEVIAASVCGASLILAFLLEPDLPVLRPLPLIGRISYSMYLLHAMLIDFFKPLIEASGVPRATRPFIFLAVLLGFSYLTYRFIEKPGIRLGKRLIAALQGPHADKAPA